MLNKVMYEIKEFFWTKPSRSFPTYQEMILIRNKLKNYKNIQCLCLDNSK
jgi:hypothetical protein